MMIFDRWGILIYKTDDIDKPWDGRANTTGKNSSPGNAVAQGDVYVYSILVTDFTSRKHSYNGIVTLLR